MTRAYFRCSVSENHAECLRLELSALRKPGEGRWFWLSAELVVDKIAASESDPSITLYLVRRPRQPKKKSVILQSD